MHWPTAWQSTAMSTISGSRKADPSANIRLSIRRSAGIYGLAVAVFLQTVDGRFEWSGTPEGIARGAGATWLARYLNALRSVTKEPIRVVAHSHGCNVVKLASQHPELDPSVKIASAVFLACPHFWEDDYVFDDSGSWLDRANITKQKPTRVGKKFRYRVNRKVFGRILNLYSQKDQVQFKLAEKLSGTYAPQTGSFLENLGNSLRTLDVFERPQATRIDEDPLARPLYEDLEVPVAAECGEIETHSVLHGAVVGRMVGRWLASGCPIKAFGAWPEIQCSDVGA